jgi:hypothetical protein
LLDIKNILKLTGKQSKKDRDSVEDLIENRTVVIMTTAGAQSRNLQKAGSIFMYDLPFSIGKFLQIVGRVTRVDTKYTAINIHIFEALDTIDSYKIALLKNNSDLIKSLFGENPNLIEAEKLDRRHIKDLRRRLLWRFK